MTEQTKCCMICNDSFKPDPRVGDRQKACSKLSCQQKRKQRNQDAWSSRNPGYFKGRYPNTKAWLEVHPGYLQTWREKRRGLDRSDIQDELTCLKTISESELSDIQDKLTTCFSKNLSKGGDSLDADIQDELRLVIPMLYLAMIYKARLRL